MRRFWRIDGGGASPTEACPSLAVELKTVARITGWSTVAAFSAIVSFLAVKWLLGYVQHHTFMIFGWYRIVLGALMLVVG